MPKTNKTITNSNGGELDSLVHGRIDLPIYNKSMAIMENFIALPEGGARFRNGTSFVRYTRLNQKAWLIPFQFSDQQAYLIEATHRRFRFYKDNNIILETPKNITAMTNANPGVFTIVGHGFATGDEIYISGLVGPTGINGKFYLVVVLSVNTFSLTDIFGNVINTTTSGAHTSGGAAARVYEINTPYDEQDIEYLQVSQNADTMYITHRNYKPNKLVRSGHASWALAYATLTADPFISTFVNISGVTNANPGVVTSAAHGFVDGQLIYFDSVGGMTQLNQNFYTVRNVTVNTFTLETRAGVAVNTAAYGAYTAGGTATTPDKYPRAVCFTDAGRLMYGGTFANPSTVWGSQAPTTGTPNYDNFTTGTNATDAIIFTLAAIQGKVDVIQWMTNTNKFVVLGTFGTLRRLFGATEQEAISPTSVTAKAVNAYGCAQLLPVANGDVLFYVQRGNKTIRSLEYDISVDGYTTTDRNIVTSHLVKQGVSQLCEQQGSPDLIWGRLSNGRLIALTYKQKEDISGWTRHYLGGSHINTDNITISNGKVIAIGNMPRALNSDQTWFVVERRINSQTVRSVEFTADRPIYPEHSEFYSYDPVEDYEEEDKTKWLNALYEQQKLSCHVDMSNTFNGSDLGRTAGATLTPSATTGTGITFTASAAVFDATMVGRELWKKYDANGDGGGRARITGYTSTTVVTCDIINEDGFNNTNAIPAGSWFLTATTISGLDYLEGETVSIQADGGTHPRRTVVGGSITLDSPTSVAIIGYRYVGRLETLNIDTGGVSGSAATKIRNVFKIAFRFYNTLGVAFGTDPYKLEPMVFRNSGDVGDRPPPLFSGIQQQTYRDRYEYDGKRIIVVQNNPAPCTLLTYDVFTGTTDDQQ